MRYSLLGGGKRLRPCLTLAVAEAVGAGLDVVSRRRAFAGLARRVRGRDDPLLLARPRRSAGDGRRRAAPRTPDDARGVRRRPRDSRRRWSADRAFVVIAQSPSPLVPAGSPHADAGRRLRAIDTLARAAGAAGMVGGQAIDLAAAGRVASVTSPHPRRRRARGHARAQDRRADPRRGDDRRHRRRRGRTSDRGDRRLRARARPGVSDRRRRARCRGSREALGKTAGKDAAAGKPTFPALYGVDESRRLAAACVDRAKQALASADLGGRLDEIADWSLARRK